MSWDAIVLSRAKVERDLAWSVGILLVGAALWVWGLVFVYGALAASPVGGASSFPLFPCFSWFAEILPGAGATMVLAGAVFTAINASLLRRGRRPARSPA